MVTLTSGQSGRRWRGDGVSERERSAVRRTRRSGRALVAAAIGSAVVLGVSTTTQAQESTTTTTAPETTTTVAPETTTTAPPETTTTLPLTNNFVLAGVRGPNGNEVVSVDEQVAGTFAHCANPNGLGAELFLEASGPSGVQVRHATVTPFVVPIHIGLLRVQDPDPVAPLNDEALTLGAVIGDSVQFGDTGRATAEYAGLFFGTSAVGVVNWRYDETIACTDSVVMPIIEPLLSGG